MGIGTYGLCNDEQKAVTIDMLEYTGAYQDEEREIQEYDYDDVQETIIDCLPKSYEANDKRSWNDKHLIVAQNTFYAVETIGWEHDIGLRVRVREEALEGGALALAYAGLSTAAYSIFDKLHKAGLPLRLRTSGYTSEAYTPMRKAA